MAVIVSFVTFVTLSALSLLLKSHELNVITAPTCGPAPRAEGGGNMAMAYPGFLPQ
jgi:hypothetical protein